MISKSTTADLLKMYSKLEEFFTQQFKSSKRVFSNLESRPLSRGGPTSLSKKQKKLNMATAAAAANGITASKEWNIQDARHHRHWQKPLKQAVGLILSTLGVPLPKSGTVLGGTMELHGRNISLACFHNVNFKAKSWALFSLRDPCINFATEAQQIETSSEVNVVQKLTFGLGMSSAQQALPQTHSMATVCRMSRNIIFPPQFKTLHEWFHYAFANSEIDGKKLSKIYKMFPCYLTLEFRFTAVDRFPVLERDKETNMNSIERSRAQTGAGSSNIKLQDHNHNREVIFALPSLRLHFKTEHVQGATTPDSAGNLYYLLFFRSSSYVTGTSVVQVMFNLIFQTINQWSNAVSSPNSRIIFL